MDLGLNFSNNTNNSEGVVDSIFMEFYNNGISKTLSAEKLAD